MVDEPPSEEIIVIAAPDPGDGAGGKRLSETEKQIMRTVAALLRAESAVYGVGAAASGPGSFLSLYLITLSAAAGVGAVGFDLIAIFDPPQPDFRRPVRVTRLGFSTTSLPQPEIVRAQRLFDVFNELIPVLKGMLDASERAQGASLAGDSRWETAHGHGMRMLMGCATAGLLQLASRMKQFRVAELDAVELNQSGYSDLQERAQRGELLPSEARAALLAAGLRRADLVAFQESIANQQIASLPVGRFIDVANDLSDQLESTALSLSAS